MSTVGSSSFRGIKLICLDVVLARLEPRRLALSDVAARMKRAGALPACQLHRGSQVVIQTLDRALCVSSFSLQETQVTPLLHNAAIA